MDIPYITDPIYYVDRSSGGSYYRRIGMYIEYNGIEPPNGIELVKGTKIHKGKVTTAQVIGWSTNKEYIMKKTKEIDVSVELYGDGTVRDVSFDDTCYGTKAKLVIEIPEKKIEITESQLNDAYYGSKDYKSFRDKLGFK